MFERHTVGPQGILAMTAGLAGRRVTVSIALGYADASGMRVFQGTADCSLAADPRGTSGFGYDPIFISGSDSGHRTYAQMTRGKEQVIPP